MWLQHSAARGATSGGHSNSMLAAAQRSLCIACRMGDERTVGLILTAVGRDAAACVEHSVSASGVPSTFARWARDPSTTPCRSPKPPPCTLQVHMGT